MMCRRYVSATAILILAWSQATAAQAGCRVTLKGNYTTPIDGAIIEVYLNGIDPPNNPGEHSQVRAKLGTWYKIKGCTWSVREFYQGDSFTVACKEDFGCGNRRYRLYARAVIDKTENTPGVPLNDGYKYYPSANGWTQKTTIDFGDLGKLLK